MDPNRSTKKRKLRPTPSHPLIGVLTRSKSQILLHRQEPDRESSSPHDYSEHRVLINDLRTKRVFSPKPIIVCSPNPKQNASTNEKLDVVVGVASESTMAGENRAAENLAVLMSFGGGRDREDINSVLSSIVKEYGVDEDSRVGLYDDGSEEVKQLDLGISCDIQNPGDENHILSMADDSGRMKTAVATDTILNQQEQSEKKGEVDGDGGLLKGIDVLNQESVQTTTPDAEVFGDGKANENEGKPQSEKKGEVDGDGGLLKGIDVFNQESVQTTPPDAEVFGDGEANENEGKPPDGILRGPDSCVGEAFSADNYKKNDSIPAAKPVLKPCFRRKLFKTPGSVSYKRLLPYLMNITTDRPYSPKSSQTPKPDKCFGQKLLQPKLDPEGQDASIHKSDTKNCSMELGAGVSGSWPTSVLISANESSSGNTADLTSSEHFTESPKIFDSQKVVDKLREEVSVNGQIKKLELDEDRGKNSNPGLSSVLEDDAKGQRKNEGIGKSEFRFPSEGREVNDVHSQSFWSIDECHSHRDFGVGKHSDDAEQTEVGGMTMVGGGSPCRAQNVNTTLSEAENSKSFNLEQRGDDDGKVQNQLDDSNEELVQMAPPDAEIFAKPDGEENGCGGAELVQKIKHHSLGTPLRGSNTKSATCASDRRKISNSNNKQVLDPCSQLKLYKIPGSFSYRRLLPHLIDIVKDNSCASGNGHCYRFHAEGHTSNSCSLPMVALASAHDSSNDNERKLKSPQDDSKFAISHASCKEDWLPMEQLHSDKYCQLEASPNQVSSVFRIGPTVASLCPPASCGTSSREEGTISVTQASVDTEADCTNSLVEHSTGAKPVGADSLSRNTTLQEAAAPTGNHSAGHNKGILKRNPRGCRGLCTCLNCASFRLHAERAFEFSQNQMQDTEEVTLDLIKELSCIRGMLEKAAHGVNNHLIVHVNQVKEACRKASEAEELAKRRLGQMNYELNIHCRIPGVQPPRVSFANYVEEKVIRSQSFQEKSISSV